MPDAPVHEVSYAFDLALIRRGMRRDILWRAIYASLVFLFAFGLCMVLLPDMLWLFGPALGFLSVFALLVLWFGYLKVSQRTLEFWTVQSPDRILRLGFHEEQLVVTTGSGSQRYAWNSMRRLWRYPDMWMFEVVKNVSVFMPPDAASHEVRDYIVRQCEAAGLKT